MSIIVVGQEVKSAVDQHTPSENCHPLGMHQKIPNPQQNQNQRDRIEDIKEVLPRLHEISGTPHFTLWCSEDKRLHCEEDEYRYVGNHCTEAGVGVEIRLVSL